MNRSRARPKATSLLLARRCYYGGEEVRIGTTDIAPEIVDSDWESSVAPTRVGAEHYAGSGVDQEMREALLLALGTHAAAQRELEAQRAQIAEARRLAKQTVQAARQAGGHTAAQLELLRMLETGALHRGVCLPWADDCVVRIAPVTPAGQRHEDLLGYTAARIRHLFAKVEGRTGRNHPFNDFEVAAEALGFEADWLQQRATMFGRGLKLELLRRRKIFTLSPREILLSHVPSEHSCLDFMPSRGPLLNLIPGLTSASRRSGGLRPEHEIKASEIGSFTHIPVTYIPFIEDWYRDLERARLHSARLMRRLERGQTIADGMFSTRRDELKMQP